MYYLRKLIRLSRVRLMRFLWEGIFLNTVSISVAVFILSVATIMLSTELTDINSKVYTLQFNLNILSESTTQYTEKNDMLEVLDPFIETGKLNMTNPYLVQQAYAAYLVLEYPTWPIDQLNEHAGSIDSLNEYKQATKVDYLTPANKVINQWEPQLEEMLKQENIISNWIVALQSTTIVLVLWLGLVDVIRGRKNNHRTFKDNS